MTGPEHYREAERLAAEVFHPNIIGTQLANRMLDAAQVHATLAHAAATAQAAVLSMCGDSDRITDWGNAIGWNTAEPRNPQPF